MSFFEAFGEGVTQLFTPSVLLALGAGTVFGWVFGVIPGLGTLNAMAIALPLMFWWDPVTGMYFFAGIMGAGSQGGAITSILLNMPGEATNAATTFDGHPLARMGRGAWAIGISAGASVYGAIFGILVLLALIPVFIPFLLSFGPAETLAVAVFGLVTMTLALPSNFFKGLVAIGVGVLLAFVGIGGPALAVPRFTMGSDFLLDGLNLVAVLVGLLVVSESIEYLARGTRRTSRSGTVIDEANTRRPYAAELTESLRGLVVPFRYPLNLLRSGAIGTGIGMIPGVGGVVAQFLSYDAAKAMSRNREQFGKGNPEGVIAAEGAVNAKEGGNLMPTLLFGIPGNAGTALLLAAWQIFGVQAGPFFLRDHADLAWALILGLLLSNILGSLMTLCTVGITSQISRIDGRYVAVSILVLVAISLVAVRGSVLDLGVGLLAGILGLGLRMFGYSVIGAAIGFVLGGILEENFYTALQSARGSYQVFVGSPISVGLLSMTALVMISVFVIRRRRAKERR